MYVDGVKLAGKKQNFNPMWKLLNKEVDLGEPTSFLDHENLGLHSKTMWNKQRYCGQLRNHVWIANFSGEIREITISLKIFVFPHGLMTWLVMQRSVWNDIVSWRTRRLNSTKYQLHALTTTTSKKKKRNLLENCQIHALKLFWTDYYLARIGRPDILWSGKKENVELTWKNSHEKRWSGRTNIISWPCIFGLHSKRVSNQKPYLLGPMTWKVTQRNVWKDIANLRIKRHDNKTKSQLHAWMTINEKQKKNESIGGLCTVCYRLFWNACIGLVLWDLISCGLWTNLLVWSQKEQKHVTNAWRVWSHTFITRVNTNSIVYVGNTAKQCRLGLFQDSDFAGDLEDSKSTSGGTVCVLGSHTFVPISWMCKRQTAVSHSSTESEIISLDTGLRLDGLPALESWI